MAQRAYANPDLNQSPATPFDMGSGFVNATAVLDPGLILDLGYEDYMSFLCGINGSAPVVLNYTSTDCGATMVNGADLNLPSITMVIQGAQTSGASKIIGIDINDDKKIKAISTITANQNITDGQTLVSDDETFEMGFFSPSNVSSNRYLGIWYNQIAVKTVVWVANRETPLTDKSSVLVLNGEGTLILFNSTNRRIWSSNSLVIGNNPVAQILDTGNLLIRNKNDNDPENYLWQSFDYPSDTILPTMKSGKDFVKGIDKNLTSWKTADDPSPGEYTLKFDSEGYPQILVSKGSEVQYSSGPWNGLRFIGMPSLKTNDI
ncbi:G-type lectin S-receptor-like serine/threonine-protein kinase isoform X1, partial [Tanacetum coccineum]